MKFVIKIPFTIVASVRHFLNVSCNYAENLLNDGTLGFNYFRKVSLSIKITILDKMNKIPGIKC